MITDHKGNIFDKISDMCSHYGIPQSAYYRKKNQNIPLPEILEPDDTAQVITDHLGNEFASITEMCKHWSVSPSTYCNRVNKQHMSVESALTVDNTVHDHTGKPFLSKKAMCEHYHISTKIYNERINDGWSQKDALTRPIKQTGVIKDHLGNEFPNQKALCDHYNISISSFTDRLKKGMSLKDALTKPKTSGVTTVYDHLGNAFRTKTEMAKFHGMSEKTVAERLRKGMSLEDALTAPSYYNNPQGPFIDHEGNEFKTMIEMARHWRLSDTILYSRLEKMSLEEALTRPTGWRGDFKDHKNNSYMSIAEMCRTYGINITTYNYRINSGWPLKAVLLLPKKTHIKNNMVLRQGYVITKQITANYYECIIDNETIICSQQKILSDMADIIEERNCYEEKETFCNN